MPRRTLFHELTFKIFTTLSSTKQKLSHEMVTDLMARTCLMVRDSYIRVGRLLRYSAAVALKLSVHVR